MGDSEGNLLNTKMLDSFQSGDFLSVLKSYGVYGIVGAIVVGILVPILFKGSKRGKQRGVPVNVGGEAGYAVRNARVTELIDVPWKGATTMAALFEQSCKKHSRNRFLGTRKLIGKEFVTASDGRKFEKLHLGDYEWQTYGEVFSRASNFASGLVKLGHDVDTRAAIFSETRAEWLIAFQVVSLHFIPFYIWFLLSTLMFSSPPPLSLQKTLQTMLTLGLLSGMLPTKYYCCNCLCISRRGRANPLTQ